MPTRQNTEAVKMRRLKKADCEVDFFFIDEVSFPCEVEWRCYRLCPKRVNIFLTFSRNIIPKTRVSQAAAPPGEPSGFGCRGALRMSLASRSSGDAARMPPSSANREANYLRCDESERHGSMVTMLLLFSRRRRKSRASRIVANFSRSRDGLRSPFRAIRVIGGKNLNQIRRAMRGRIAPAAERGTSVLLMARPTGVIRLRAATT